MFWLIFILKSGKKIFVTEAEAHLDPHLKPTDLLINYDDDTDRSVGLYSLRQCLCIRDAGALYKAYWWDAQVESSWKRSNLGGYVEVKQSASVSVECAEYKSDRQGWRLGNICGSKNGGKKSSTGKERGIVGKAFFLQQP